MKPDFIPDYLYSFSRRHGKTLTPRKKQVMRELFPEIEITRESIADGTSIDTLFPENPAPISVSLEIGFGAGEHLAGLAKANPEMACIGCEPFINGVAALVDHMDVGDIHNIRIYPDDVRELIAALPDDCINTIYILFPDPWPKTRHHKRRLVNQQTLSMLSRVQKKSGKLLLASDHHGYASWMLEHVMAHPDYAWTAKEKADWLTPPSFWVNTRYETKAMASDVPIFIECLRR